jgi:hypothetical protein
VLNRGTAISIAMVSTTFEAFAGPNLLCMGRFATTIGVPGRRSIHFSSRPTLLPALYLAIRPDLLPWQSHEEQKTSDSVF